MLRCSEHGAKVHHWQGEGRIYEIWNWAIQQGKKNGCSTVSILNDDIEIDGESVHRIDMEMGCLDGLALVGWDWTDDEVAEPGIQQVFGSYRKRGIGGFAFMVKPNDVPYIDERFNWWGGDDDLFMGTMAAGHNIGLFMGEKVRHHTSTSATANPQVYDRCSDDRQLLLDRWGETW
jgi:hypothetical protein